MLFWLRAHLFIVKANALRELTPLEIVVCLWGTLRCSTTAEAPAHSVGLQVKPIVTSDSLVMP